MAKTQQPVTARETQPAADDPAQRQGLLVRLGLLLGVLLIALVYILPGLVGHDPWKQDEAYSFGIIYNMVTTGDLVVPTLAADPFLEKPPAYYISAVGMVHLLGDWLPMHDAARVTTGVYLAVAFLFTGLWARRAWGPCLGGAAVLGLIGCLGLLVHGHYLITDIALTAGMAMGGYGLLRAREAAGWGGLWLGTGVGLAFLSKGLLGPGILGVAAFLLLAFGDWRNWVYPRALVVALVVAAPWLLIWPAELYLRSPDLFRLWLVDNNLGRYLGGAHLGPPADPGFWLRTVPWVTFPLLPLALWTLARRPSRAFANAGVRVALAVSLVGWGVLLSSGTGRDLYALPLLAPLAVIAAGGLRDLPGWLISLLYWLCLIAFAGLAAVLWWFWGYGLVAGHPPQLPNLGKVLPLDFLPALDLTAALLALALTLAWVLAMKRLRPPRQAALAAWPLGLTLGWGLVMLLHLPWLDAAKSYRGVFTEVASRLPAGHGCVATPADEKDPGKLTPWNRMYLRESERGLLHYFAGVKAEGAADLAAVGCDWLLLEAGRGTPPEAVDLGPGWERVWEGRRPADRRDTFLLFRRVQAPEPDRGHDSSDSAADAAVAPSPENGPGGEPSVPVGGEEPAPLTEPERQDEAEPRAEPEPRQRPESEPGPQVEPAPEQEPASEPASSQTLEPEPLPAAVPEPDQPQSEPVRESRPHG